MAKQSHPVARVYAAALVEIGRDTRSLPAIEGDLVAVQRLYDGDAWFRAFFTSPRIDRDVKWKALEKALAGKLGRPVTGLLRVLVKKGRESIYDDVVVQFDKFKDEAEHRVHAYVTVARAMPADVRGLLEGRLASAAGMSVAVHERVDPGVLGGAAIRVGDRVIDRTLKTRLAALRRRLLETT